MNKKEVISHLNPVFFKGIAHRGYHNEKYTENGIKAFQNAIDHGLAIELDVHLTRDGQLIVCHDSNLVRTTGKEGIIEHLSVKEIKENYHLLDGGEIPTFQEVLKLIDEKVPLVIELKVYEKNYKEIAKRLKEELKDIKDKKNYMLISFDPRSLIPFKHYGIMRSLLIAKDHFWVYKFRHFFESVDLDQKLFNMPRIQKYHKKHLVNCWTITSEEELEKVVPYVDLVTFQEMDYQAVQNNIKVNN